MENTQVTKKTIIRDGKEVVVTVYPPSGYTGFVRDVRTRRIKSGKKGTMK